MKVAFDEHIPPEMVTPVKSLLEKKGPIEVVLARDYAEPPSKSDTPWLIKFAADGGRVVVTGDKDMRARLDEQAALKDLGLIVFFDDPCATIPPPQNGQRPAVTFGASVVSAPQVAQRTVI